MARVMDDKDTAYRVRIAVVRRWPDQGKARIEFCYYGPFGTLAQARMVRTLKVREFMRRDLEVIGHGVEECAGWRKVPDNGRLPSDLPPSTHL